ncbi:MAG: hypothetical protein Q9M92_01575 [Enterobacterales bacterium]|nr:hypothetical protein [Enterobacterales bacterium]
MRHPQGGKHLWLWLIISSGLCLNPILSQAATQAKGHSIAQLKQELNQLKQAYQDKISALEERLEQLEESADEAEERTDNLAVEVSQQSNQQAANTFNPGIGVILNGRFQAISPNNFDFNVPGFFPADEIGPGSSGLSLGESELNLSANVDDKFYASTTLSFGDGAANVEEAYLQTIALPKGLQVKFGRFFSSIGYLASRHTHTDDFAERPLAYEAFLGGQYGDAGVQVSWLAPTDIYWESGTEFYQGDSFPAAGSGHNGSGVYTLYSHIGDDINANQSWRFGLSHLNARVVDRTAIDGSLFSGDSDLTIADFIWKWAPDGNPFIHNAKIQAEYLSRKEKGLFTDPTGLASPLNSQQSGYYVQGIYQFMPQWRVGLRYSRLKADDLLAVFDNSLLDNQGLTPKRTSFMLDWSNSEFSRLRLQYSRDQAGLTDADIWTLQYIAAFGAHGAHSF